MDSLLPFTNSVASAVRLVRSLHEQALNPMIYHVSNLFPMYEEQEEENENNIRSVVSIVRDKKNQPLMTLKKSNEVQEQTEVHLNCIIERLPLDAHDLVQVQNEVNQTGPYEIVPHDEALFMLLFRCAQIMKTLKIRKIVWPSDKEHVIEKWKEQDPLSRNVQVILLTDPKNPKLFLLDLYKYDKELINKKLDEKYHEDKVERIVEEIEGCYFDPEYNILELFNLDHLYDPYGDLEEEEDKEVFSEEEIGADEQPAETIQDYYENLTMHLSKKDYELDSDEDDNEQYNMKEQIKVFHLNHHDE
jgi:hypothetical protein